MESNTYFPILMIIMIQELLAILNKVMRDLPSNHHNNVVGFTQMKFNYRILQDILGNGNIVICFTLCLL